MCRRTVTSFVKVRGSIPEVPFKLPVLSNSRDALIHGVAVKCLDMKKKSAREGRFPECNLR